MHWILIYSHWDFTITLSLWVLTEIIRNIFLMISGFKNLYSFLFDQINTFTQWIWMRPQKLGINSPTLPDALKITNRVDIYIQIVIIKWNENKQSFRKLGWSMPQGQTSQFWFTFIFKQNALIQTIRIQTKKTTKKASLPLQHFLVNVHNTLLVNQYWLGSHNFKKIIIIISLPGMLISKTKGSNEIYAGSNKINQSKNAIWLHSLTLISSNHR